MDNEIIELLSFKDRQLKLHPIVLQSDRWSSKLFLTNFSYFLCFYLSGQKKDDRKWGERDGEWKGPQQESNQGRCGWWSVPTRTPLPFIHWFLGPSLSCSSPLHFLAFQLLFLPSFSLPSLYTPSTSSYISDSFLFSHLHKQNISAVGNSTIFSPENAPSLAIFMLATLNVNGSFSGSRSSFCVAHSGCFPPLFSAESSVM